jgi:heme/copper-type cytochrome/quinol oxidase subunit 2
MCGIGHGIMNARIHIQDPKTHSKWIADRAETKAVKTKHAALDVGEDTSALVTLKRR